MYIFMVMHACFMVINTYNIPNIWYKSAAYRDYNYEISHYEEIMTKGWKFEYQRKLQQSPKRIYLYTEWLQMSVYHCDHLKKLKK